MNNEELKESLNIPVYRAKKIDNDDYIQGWYSDPVIINSKLYLSITNKDGVFRIDTTTLSIHFPDMLDSQGNNIFASLSEDGKGGDVVNNGNGESVIAIYENGEIRFRYEEGLPHTQENIDKCEDDEFIGFFELWQIKEKLESEVVGIQK